MSRPVPDGSGVLGTLDRNAFWYGKLMDVSAFKKEQEYFRRKSALLNRFVIGSGVVFGLKLEDASELDKVLVHIHPGLAFDGLGREIINPESFLIDPRQLTNESGEPTGALLSNDSIAEICLVYTEKKTDPVPVLVAHCDTPGNCAHSTIREGFCVIVREVDEVSTPVPTCEVEEFPKSPNEIHQLLCERLANVRPPLKADPCVSLGRVKLNDNGAIDLVYLHAGRRLVYNNALLFEMVLCLADQIGKLEGRIYELESLS